VNTEILLYQFLELLLLGSVVCEVVEDHLQISRLLYQQEVVHLKEGGSRGLFGKVCLNGGGGGSIFFGCLVLHLSLYFWNQVRLSLQEEWVVVVVEIFAAFFGEAVHVELPDERVQVAVLEVEGKDYLGESLGAEDNEPVLVLGPSDDVAVLGFLLRGRNTWSIS
jgi:hypothetical protein